MNEIINADHVASTSNRRQALNRLVGAAAVALTLPACGGGGGDGSDAPANTNPATTPTPGSPAGNRQVVVAGIEYDNLESNVGKVWVNGVESTLRVSDTAKQSDPKAVTFGPDGYVVSGYSYMPGAPIDGSIGNIKFGEARLWYANGIPQNLTADLPATPGRKFYASGIAIDQSNAYVSGGFEFGFPRVALYWKNAVPTILSTDGNPYENTSGIFVKDNDIYVSGTQGVNPIAVYWKNGTKFVLSSSVSRATSIVVDGSGVYVAGITSTSLLGLSAVVWKNGVEQLLAGGYQALSIALGGFDDVYVAGIGIASNNVQVARLWKNGVVQELEGLGENESGANAVVVVGNDVYVAGYIGAAPVSQGSRAALWVNGKLTTLTSIDSTSKSTKAVALAVR